MNAIKPEEERFADTAIQLSKAIHYNITTLYNLGYKTIDPNVVLMVSNGILFFDKHQLIQGFIINSHSTCWEKIKERDEKFFIENANDIFKLIPAGEVNLFKDLFTTKDSNGNDIINQDIKTQIWKLFDAMVKICIKYIHKQRAPFSQKSNETIQYFYERSFFDEVDVRTHSEKWGIALEFHPKI
jgi:hypothetical protein